MKLPVPAAACAFLFMPSLCGAEAAMAPDPLMQRPAPVPFTAADLIVRTKTEAPGVNLWRLAGELDALTTEQVRTVACNCWRPYRRFEAEALYAATAALSLWAERDLADAAGTLMFIGSWEDMDDTIGDYDIDLESEAGWLWAQLAQRDWKKAKALLDKVSGEESTGQFAGSAIAHSNLTPAQAAQFVAIFAPKPMEGGGLEDIVKGLVNHLAEKSGLPATRAWAKSLQPAKARKMALSILAGRKEEPPQSPQPAPPVFSDDTLGKLRALDNRGAWIMPFPLYRAVRALSPAEAMQLADEAAARPLPGEGAFLRWMLFMRASEGDPAAAARLACGPPFGDSTPALTDVFAQRKDVSAALEEIGRMPDEMRAAALTGLLMHADIADPAKWLQTIAGLKVDTWAAAPMFARLGATGKGREAFALAASLESESAAAPLANATLDTWILTDIRGFFAFFKEKAAGAEGEFLELKDVSITAESPVSRMKAFGARELLQDDDPVPPKYLNWNDAPWTFFAFEDREITFRYLERHADDADYEGPIAWFSDAAVRFEPERAMALRSRAATAHLAWVRRQNVVPDADAPDEPALEADRFEYGVIRRRVVQFWPEKALTLLTPATDREWEALCMAMLERHPQHLTKLVQKVPKAVRQSLAKLLTAADSASLSAEKRRYLTEALRAAK